MLKQTEIIIGYLVNYTLINKKQVKDVLRTNNVRKISNMLGVNMRMPMLHILPSHYLHNRHDGTFWEIQESLSSWPQLLHTLRTTNKTDIPPNSCCGHAEANCLHQGQYEPHDRYSSVLSDNRPIQSNLHCQRYTSQHHATHFRHFADSLWRICKYLFMA